MPGISSDTIEQVRAQCDLVDIVGDYVTLKRAGAGFKGLSPFQKEKTPSFHVQPDKQLYYCFSSGKGGDLFRFVMEMEGVDFPTAVRLLAQRAGIPIHEDEQETGSENRISKDRLLDVTDRAAEWFHDLLLTSPDARHARTYCEDRALAPDILRTFRIGYCPPDPQAVRTWARKNNLDEDLLLETGLVRASDRGGTYCPFRGRLMFPIRDELGRTLGFSGRVLEKDAPGGKYVNTHETSLFHKSRVLYGLDRARRPMADRRAALLCEGQIDVIRAQMEGFDTAVAPQGTALTETHVALLKRYADEVTVLYDSDEAGRKAAVRTAELCIAAEMEVRIAALPAGGDPDSILLSDGREALEDFIRRADFAVPFYVHALAAQNDFQDPAALRRSVRQVIQLIARAPGAVQQEQLVDQAAGALPVSREALGAELRRAQKQARSGARFRRDRAARGGEGEASAAEAASPAAPARPPEEVALVELLLEQPQEIDFVAQYLSADDLRDEVCRRLVRAMITSPDPAQEVPAQFSDDPDAMSIIAQTQIAPKSASMTEVSPHQAAQDLLLVFQRKALERRCARIREQMADLGAGEDLNRLLIESQQLRHDINILRQGWEKAEPVLQLLHEEEDV